MPFFDDEDRPAMGSIAPPITEEVPPTVGEQAKAAFQKENMIVSRLSRAAVPEYFAFDPEYDPWQDIKGSEYEDHWSDFAYVRSKKHADALRLDIDREKENDRILNASGWSGMFWRGVAGVADFPTLFPGGAGVRAGKIGYSAIKTAKNVGVAASGAAAFAEAGLQATQNTRTKTESAINIGGSFVLGSLLGAAGAKLLSKKEWRTFSKALDGDLATPPDDTVSTISHIVKRGVDAGAASVDEIPREAFDILGTGKAGATAKFIAKWTGILRINPGIQLMMSPAKKTREIYSRMMENPIFMTMHREGKTLGSAAETAVKRHERGALARWVSKRNDLYSDAVKDGYRGNKHAFNEAVGRAMRRNDVDTETGSAFIGAAAREGRKVVDDLLKEAQALRMLPDDVHVATAPSYFTRIWRQKALIDREEEFRGITQRWLHKHPDMTPDKFVSKDDMEDYIEEVTTEIFNNLTGQGRGNVPVWAVPAKRGPLKERTFGIPDELVLDFLEDDAELVLRRYTRTMGAEVELQARGLDPKNFENVEIDGIKKEYAALRAEAGKIKDAAKRSKEKSRLRKHEKRDIEYLRDFRDMVRGTYRQAEHSSNMGKITRAALAFNYLRLLGGVMVSSFADVARHIGVHGARAMFKEALPSLINNLDAVKLSVKEARELGAVTERVLQGRLATLAELTDPHAIGDPFERLMHNATSQFTKATGLPFWNDIQKGIFAMMTQNRIIRNAGKSFAKLDKFERQYMAYLGIDEMMGKRINKMFAKHGRMDGEVALANTSDWTDDAAMRAYADALNKDVDRGIVTKGFSDSPFWMHSNSGKLIMQFKSFALASHQRVLIAGLQERPRRFAEMMALAIPVGMMVTWLKQEERGEAGEKQLERLMNNPGLLISEGADRSGLFAIPFEISNVVEKFGGAGISRGIQELTGDEDKGGHLSRFASRNPLGTLGGPAAGLLQDLITIATNLNSKAGARAVERVIPGRSLPGVRTLSQNVLKPMLEDALDDDESP